MLMLRPVWGIDIGDSSLKAVKLKRVGKQIVLLDFRIIRYSDVTGKPGANREEALPEVLSMLLAAGIGRDPCVVSIAPQAVFSRFISLPPVDKRRIPEIVLYEARQQIPFSLDEVIWTYQPVRKEFVPGEEIEIGLFAIKRDVVASYLADINLISARLQGIQVSPLALYNFVRHDVPLEKPTVVMDIGAQSTDLLILDGPRFWMRNLPIAGNSFTSALEKRLNISRPDAEKLKHDIPEHRHRRKLLEILRPVMRDMVGEIQRSIGYYKSLSQDVKFEDILVTGDGYKLLGLDRFLTEQLQYRVSPLNQLRNIVAQGPSDLAEKLAEALQSLAVAIGLALQGIGGASVTTDLLPDDFVIQRELHRKRFSGLIAAGLVWAIVGCFFLKEKRTLAEMGEIGLMGEGTLTNVKKLKADYTRARKGTEADQRRLKMFEGLGAQREYYARLAGAIAEVIPTGIEIEGDLLFSEEGAGMDSIRRGGGARRVGAGRPGRRVRGAGAMSRERAVEEEIDAEDAEERERVGGSAITLTFAVTGQAGKEPEVLTEELPRHLKRAVVFPEKVPVVTGVVVDDVKLTVEGGVARRDNAPTLRRPTAQITVGFLSAEQAIKRRDGKEITPKKKKAKARGASGRRPDERPPSAGPRHP